MHEMLILLFIVITTGAGQLLKVVGHNVLVPRNCTSHLSQQFIDSILNESVVQSSRSDSHVHGVERARSHRVPDDYVVTCLKAAPYDPDIIPPTPSVDSISYANEAETQRLVLRFAFSVCEVLSLAFDGTLRMWAQLEIAWTDKRLAWDTSVFNEPPLREKESARNASTVGFNLKAFSNYTNQSEAAEHTKQQRSALLLLWPENIMYPSDLIWSPVLRVLNCHGDACYVRVPSNSSALLQFDGEVFTKVPKTFESTCDIRLENFPFDNQTCEVLISLLSAATLH